MRYCRSSRAGFLMSSSTRTTTPSASGTALGDAEEEEEATDLRQQQQAENAFQKMRTVVVVFCDLCGMTRRFFPSLTSTAARCCRRSH